MVRRSEKDKSRTHKKDSISKSPSILMKQANPFVTTTEDTTSYAISLAVHGFRAQSQKKIGTY